MPRPINLRDHEVRALLADGRVLVVRAVKPQGNQPWLSDWFLHSAPTATICPPERGIQLCQFEHPLGGPLTCIKCPLGAVGDTTWGRETWWKLSSIGSERASYADGSQKIVLDNGLWKLKTREQSSWHASNYPKIWGNKNSPQSMPHWASRFPRLRIESVRVIRLQEITEDQARTAGTERTDDLTGTADDITSLRMAFWLRWNRDNPTWASYNCNPWVWAVEVRNEELTSELESKHV